MKLTIPRDRLLAALALPSRVAERKETIPILSHARLIAKGQTLAVEATNLELGARISVDADVTTAGETCVSASRLHAAVKSFAGGSDVAVSVALDRARLKLVCGRATVRLPTLDPKDFPALPKAPDGGVSLPLAALSASVGYAVTTDTTLFPIAAALLEREGGKVRAVATDGRRMAIAEADSDAPAAEPVMLTKAFMDALDLFGQGRFSTDGRHLFLCDDRRMLVARCVENQFPDWRKVRPEPKQSASVDAANLAGAIRRAQTVAEAKREHRLKLAFDGNQLTLSTRTVDTGETDETIDINGADKLEVGLQAHYLLDAVQQMGEGGIVFGWVNEASPVLLRPAEPGSVRVEAIVMPMRL